MGTWPERRRALKTRVWYRLPGRPVLRFLWMYVVKRGFLDGRQGLVYSELIAAYEAIIKDAKTVVWNGPMGVFEVEAFAAGTTAIARAVAAVRGTTIIGGGDSIAAVNKAGVSERITHISTGGGASLEFLGGRRLPGVEALSEKQ